MVVPKDIECIIDVQNSGKSPATVKLAKVLPNVQDLARFPDWKASAAHLIVLETSGISSRTVPDSVALSGVRAADGGAQPVATFTMILTPLLHNALPVWLLLPQEAEQASKEAASGTDTPVEADRKKGLMSKIGQAIGDALKGAFVREQHASLDKDTKLQLVGEVLPGLLESFLRDYTFPLESSPHLLSAAELLAEPADLPLWQAFFSGKGRGDKGIGEGVGGSCRILDW